MATPKKPTTASIAPTDTVETVREQIVRIKAELTAIATAPVPVEDAIAQLHAGLDHLADPAAYTSSADRILRAFTRPGVDVASAELLIPAEPQYDTQRFRAFLLTMFGDQIRPVLTARLEALYADPDLRAAFPLHDRPARLAELRERLRAVELEEERLVLASERQGAPVTRRGDADPTIVFDAAVLLEEPSA